MAERCCAGGAIFCSLNLYIQHFVRTFQEYNVPCRIQDLDVTEFVKARAVFRRGHVNEHNCGL